MCFVNASPCSSTLRIHCAFERNGKCSTSIGCHVVSVLNELSASPWLPRATVTSWIRAMRDLDDRPVKARRVVDRRVLRQASGHALRDGLPVLGPRDERAPEALHDAVLLRDRSQHFLERAAARPPEFIRVCIDDPVRAVLGRREPRHARAPLAVVHLARTRGFRGADRRARIARGSRSYRRRLMVGCDDEVDPGVEVVRELVVDDIRLVARRRASQQSFIGREPYGRDDPQAGKPDVRCRRAIVVVARPRPPRTPGRGVGWSSKNGRARRRAAPSPRARSASRRRVSIARLPVRDPLRTAAFVERERSHMRIGLVGAAVCCALARSARRFACQPVHVFSYLRAHCSRERSGK